MLLLVAAHGHQVRLVKQDVRRHQRRVGEKAGVDIVGIFGALILELGHAGKLAEHGVAIQHPTQLGVSRHMGLDEQHVLLRVQAAGNVGRQLCQRAAAQVRRYLAHRDGVHIRQHIKAVVFIRQRRPVADGAEIGAQCQVARGLNSAQNPFFLYLFHDFRTSISGAAALRRAGKFPYTVL